MLSTTNSELVSTLSFLCYGLSGARLVVPPPLAVVSLFTVGRKIYVNVELCSNREMYTQSSMGMEHIKYTRTKMYVNVGQDERQFFFIFY